VTTWTDVSTTATVYIDDGDLSGYVDPGYMESDYVFFSLWDVVTTTSTIWSPA
jgi:hypothetical protein